MSAETDELYQQKTREQANLFSNIAMWLSLFLFAILLLYVFVPSVFFSKKDTGDAMPTNDSMRTVIQKDTVKIDSITKSYRLTEEKVIRSVIKKANTSCEDCTSVNDRLEGTYKYFILLFGVMLATILIPRIKSVKATTSGLEVDTYEKVQRNKREEENLSPPPKDEVPIETKRSQQGMRDAQHGLRDDATQILSYTSDPQKKKWGEKAEVNFRRLTATVKQSSISKELFDIELKVISTNSDSPLKGSVIFHLHPTFSNSTPEIYVINGVAQLKLKAWGAFTVGAVADNGITKLELDLAELANAPELFKSR